MTYALPTSSTPPKPLFRAEREIDTDGDGCETPTYRTLVTHPEWSRCAFTGEAVLGTVAAFESAEQAEWVANALNAQAKAQSRRNVERMSGEMHSQFAPAEPSQAPEQAGLGSIVHNDDT